MTPLPPSLATQLDQSLATATASLTLAHTIHHALTQLLPRTTLGDPTSSPNPRTTNHGQRTTENEQRPTNNDTIPLTTYNRGAPQ